MRRLIAFALAVAACKGGDRSDLPASQNATATATVRGPDALLLRVPRNGGIPRVTVYSNADSVVWTATEDGHVEHLDAGAYGNPLPLVGDAKKLRAPFETGRRCVT